MGKPALIKEMEGAIAPLKRSNTHAPKGTLMPMAIHRLEPEGPNLRGSVSNEYAPVLSIQSNDVIHASCLDAAWNLVYQPGPFGTYIAHPDKEGGHCLLGPVAIAGAEPGDTLEIETAVLRTARFGWTCAAWPDAPFSEALGLADQPVEWMKYRIDPDKGTALAEDGLEFGLRPFLGYIGLAPAAPGEHPTRPPRRTGGNIDFKDLGVGSKLFLPVEVAGGLLSFGDGHARQGDGEVAGPAIETPMEEVKLMVRLHKQQWIDGPFAHCALGWVTFGFSPDIEEAMVQALNHMLDLMVLSFGLTRAKATALASAFVDLRITQIVNQTKGVHAVLTWEAIHQLAPQ